MMHPPAAQLFLFNYLSIFASGLTCSPCSTGGDCPACVLPRDYIALVEEHLLVSSPAGLGRIVPKIGPTHASLDELSQFHAPHTLPTS